MDRESEKYPKFRVHWSVKLLGCAWVIAVVFIAGMVIGGMLSEHDGDGGTGVPGKVQAAQNVKKADLVLETPCLDQREGFPTGCESVTAVMALNYAGVDISVSDFVDRYLPLGVGPYAMGGDLFCSDPNQFFLGDPRSEDGWGCYAPVIKSAAGRVLEDNKPERSVAELSGKTLRELMDGYIAQGVPVMLWATRGMAGPSYGETLIVEGTGRRFDWIRPEHCLLLVGETDDTYLFNDPLEGEMTEYDKKAVQTAYEALGSQALAIE